MRRRVGPNSKASAGKLWQVNERYSLEKIFDYIISRLVALKKLTDIARFKPDPSHLQGQRRRRNSLKFHLLELLG
jgi:hypothetical protein